MAELPAYPGTPRWVKLSGIIAGALALLVVILVLGGGEHGPGRHVAPSSVTEPGGQPP